MSGSCVVCFTLLMSYDRMKPRSGNLAGAIDILQEAAITDLSNGSNVYWHHWFRECYQCQGKTYYCLWISLALFGLKTFGLLDLDVASPAITHVASPPEVIGAWGTIGGSTYHAEERRPFLAGPVAAPPMLQNSNPNFPVNSSLVYCEHDASGHAATEAVVDWCESSLSQNTGLHMRGKSGFTSQSDVLRLVFPMAFHPPFTLMQRVPSIGTSRERMLIPLRRHCKLLLATMPQTSLRNQLIL
uniref:Uncharacterized protein n=1 Tax=Timema douglasi TaxID=61478 RepID=A0A7R8VEY5_TIMDO|nr:unnamed protein product [Timema douglasi]